jgi:hypothetical protein
VQVNLLHEERIALRLAVNHTQQLLGHGLLGQRHHHRAYTVEGEPAEA